MRPWERTDLVVVEETPQGQAATQVTGPKPWERQDLVSRQSGDTREQLARTMTHPPQAQRPPPTGPQAPAYQRLPAAIAEPVIRTGLGIRKAVMQHYPQSWQEMAAPMTEGMERDLAAAQKTQGEGPLTTAGNIVGELGMFAGPGGAGGAVARRAFPKALGLATAGGEAAGIGALAAARAEPGERAQEALTEGVSTLAGHGVGQVLTKALGGVPRSQAGQRMLDEGLPLTPGQAARGSVVPFVEERMAYVPGLAGPTGKLQRKAVAAWNIKQLQNNLPDIPGYPKPTITEAGPVGFQQVQNLYMKLYDDIYGMAGQAMKPDQWQWFATSLRQLSQGKALKELDDQTARRITNFIGQRADRLAKNPRPQDLQRFFQDARKLGSELRVKGDYTAAELVDEALEGLEVVITPELASALRATNRGYAAYKTLERAGSYKSALANEGLYTPDNLLSAVKARSKERQLVTGRAPLQREALEAGATVGAPMARRGTAERYVSPAAVAGAALVDPVTTGAAVVGGRTLLNEPVRRLLTGAYTPSAGLADSLRRWAGRGAAAVNTQEGY